MDYSKLDGDDAPSISLQVPGCSAGGANSDENVWLRPSEARSLAAALCVRADYLEGKGGSPSVV